MPGVLLMAALTILGSAILCITALNSLTGADRRFYWLALVSLPFSLIVNRWIKIQFITAIASQTGIPLKLEPEAPSWFIVLIWFNAPVFEEAIKMLPAVLPVARTFLKDPSRSMWGGLALGMGFGLGEAAYLAYGLSRSAEFNQLPWHMFTGFAVERLFVTFAHGFLTAIAVSGFYCWGRKAVFGYLSAVGLHALINLGPILLVLKLIPQAVSTMGTYLAILAAFAIFQKNLRLARKRNWATKEEIIYFER